MQPDNNLLWQPTEEIVRQSNLMHYMHWLAENKNLHFSTYPALWNWSVTHIEDFWESLWSYFNLKYSGSWQTPNRVEAKPLTDGLYGWGTAGRRRDQGQARATVSG